MRSSRLLIGLVFAVGLLTAGALAGITVVAVWAFAVIARRLILIIADAVPGLAGVLGT